jgi:hypothetical protein
MMDLNLTPERLASLVIGSTGGAAIKGHILSGIRTYDWVQDYVRDKKIREKINGLQNETAQARALPIHKEELRAMFESRVKAIDDFRLQQVSSHLADVQQRNRQLFNEYSIGEWKLLGVSMLPYLMTFSPGEIDTIFADLPEGVSKSDIENTIVRCQKEIEELEIILNKELNPKERWFYRENGDPYPYPKGCRWTLFVETWKKVVARFEGQVDIEGCQLETAEERMAFGLLEMERVGKMPPLRKVV